MNHTASKSSESIRSALSCAVPALVLLMSACAGQGGPPREQMAVSKAAVDRASGQNAAEAPVALAAARDKMARAQQAYSDKDYRLARQLAEQAEADAVLAEAQARSERAGLALAEVRESIRQLLAEIERSAS